MSQILVIGAGFMGTGIAQVCAQAGYYVNLMDTNASALEKSIEAMHDSLKKLQQKGFIEEHPRTVLERISLVEDLSSASLVDWVIEAVPEVEDLKKEIFHELDKSAADNTILATNTSTIPITRIAEVTKKQERVIGLHFFGPVPLMGIVEVVKGKNTSDDVFSRSVSFVESLKKRPIRVMKDIPGFVMNRIFAAAFKEALELVDKGISTPEDIDAGMKLGYGWRAGPFEIADNAGLDTYLLVGMTMKTLGEEHLVPDSDLIERMVNKGRLGRKVLKGFYTYGPEGRRLPWDRGRDLP
ncbi:MAG: 3-hydroxybutyryl-CoA dehydrogenase [Deltaproteobacteria bacterium]|nr:MAG: 3-hydroxybutyryl-CoA dehydrogenase [Deltaproteobacteria bacterium]